MRDKSLDVLLMILFGIGGITIMVLTWSQTMQLPERILSTSIGMIGLIWTAARLRLLKSMPGELVAQRNEVQDSTMVGNNSGFHGIQPAMGRRREGRIDICPNCDCKIELQNKKF